MGREGRGGGSIDTQLWKMSILRWGGRGGEGGIKILKFGFGGGSIDTQLWNMSIRWGGEGRGVNRHSTLEDVNS